MFYPGSNFFPSRKKYDPGCSSRIRMLTFYPSRILDPGVKKAPGPGSGSATLIQAIFYRYHMPNWVRWSRTRIKVKARIRIRIKVQIQEVWRVKMGPWRAEDTQWRRGCSKMGPRRPCSQWSQIRITLMRNWIRIPFKVKILIWIRIRIKVIRIPNIAWKLKIRIRSASACFTVFLQPWSFCF